MIIDSHQHWVPASFILNPERFLWKEDTIERRGDRYNIWRHGFLIQPRFGEEFYSVESRLKAMDQAGIGKAVLNADGLIEWLDIGLSREFNNELAEFVKQDPNRFIGLGSIPPEDEGCVEEVDRAINTLGFKGVSICTHSLRKGLPVDAKEYWPFYRKVNELDVPIALHPANLPPEHEMFRDYDLARTFGRPVSITLACLRLLQSELVEEFPRLRFLLPHMGGTFFAMKDRVLGSYLQHGGKPVDFEARLDHFYFDTAPPYWRKAPIDCALATFGPRRILFGTDYPLGSDFLTRGVTMVKGWQMDGGINQGIFSENALRLWKI